MKRLFVCLVVSSTVFQLQAAIVFYDSFDYAPAGDQLSSAGFAAWALRNSPQVDPTVISGSLSYPGLKTASGDNSVAWNGTGPSGIATQLLDQIYSINNAPTVYYSFTFQVSSIGTADWGGATPSNYLTGSFMMGFTQDSGGGLANASVAAPLLIRTGDPTNATGTANDFQGFQLGTGVTAVQSTASRIFDGTRVYAPGVTLFLVLAYTFGPSANDDVAQLWVNPTPGSLESANVPVVTTIPTAGIADVTNSQVQSFFLRNNSVQPTTAIVDDLRVGTTWGDVTPVPEPSAFGMMVLGVAGLTVRRLRR